MPATVSASVPVDVMGEPATEIRPPVKDWATDVTVPDVAGAAEVQFVPFDVSTLPLVPAVAGKVAVVHVGAPAPPLRISCPEVPAASRLVVATPD